MKNHSFITRTTTLFPSKLAALAGAVLVTGAFALLVGAFTDKAMAQNPSGGASAQSFAVGGFTTPFTLEHVAFAAHSNPKKPGFYVGHVVQEYMDGTSTSGPVTCVGVFSNFAIISFRIDHGANPGTYRSFQVQDNGQPNAFPPDGYQDCGPSNNNGNCDCPSGGFEFIAKGNIVVSP